MRDYLATVQTHYPSAQITREALDRYLEIIKIKLSLQPSQIALADSLCCDEVDSLQFPKNDMIGPFKMGGLGGYPFAGLTGMAAFSSHIPEGGGAILFYGPHIGITRDGTIGKTKRAGQQAHSRCCGSATGALSNFLDNNIKPADITGPDYQQQVIEQLLLEQGERLKGTEKPVWETIQILYEAIDQQISFLVGQTAFPCQYIIKCGGIFINGDNGEGSFWDAKRFEAIDTKNDETIQLLENQ